MIKTNHENHCERCGCERSPIVALIFDAIGRQVCANGLECLKGIRLQNRHDVLNAQPFASIPQRRFADAIAKQRGLKLDYLTQTYIGLEPLRVSQNALSALIQAIKQREIAA